MDPQIKSPYTYRFDYIRDEVLGWNPDVLRKCSVSFLLRTLPHTIHPAIISRSSSTPTTDYYGEEIVDMKDYLNQRAAYISNLHKEIAEIIKERL